MATIASSYSPYMYHQQPYYYPTISSVSSAPYVASNYYAPQQPQPQPQQIPSVQYVDSSVQSLRPRRAPRIYREVIRLPTPEPIYRQVRHRMVTPERQVIQRTVIQKANGNVIVQQQRPSTKTRHQSRFEPRTQARSSRSRQVYAD